MEKQFVVVICGPTASGKSTLAIDLAKEFNGEIISADSMQVYKGMQIATAKPSLEQMGGIPHHLMSFHDPKDSFSVAEYVKLAREKILEIIDRNKLPIICGGTGLYIDSLIDNIQFNDKIPYDYGYRNHLREIAAEKGNGFLLEQLGKIDPETASKLHENNLSRVIRALEVHKISGKKMSDMQAESKSVPSPYDACMIALDYDREILYERINSRVDLMLVEGLINEARDFYSHDYYPTAVQAIGYKELKPFVEGKAGLEECVECLKQETRKYAKRQLTWFRRNKKIHWVKVGNSNSYREILENTKNYIKSCSNYK